MEFLQKHLYFKKKLKCQKKSMATNCISDPLAKVETHIRCTRRNDYKAKSLEGVSKQHLKEHQNSIRRHIKIAPKGASNQHFKAHQISTQRCIKIALKAHQSITERCITKVKLASIIKFIFDMANIVIVKYQETSVLRFFVQPII